MLNINGPEFNYDEYMLWVKALVAAHKTSGNRQSEDLVNFTALNLKRMERINKSLIINSHLTGLLNQITEAQTWYVITEAWCGDSAQNLPAIAAISYASAKKIRLKIIWRDENPEWIEKYNTEGAASIPKLIAFDPSGHELFVWGPRPAPAQELLLAWKFSLHKTSWETFETELHTWYARDKSLSLQHEFYDLLQPLAANKPVDEMLPDTGNIAILGS